MQRLMVGWWLFMVITSAEKFQDASDATLSTSNAPFTAPSHFGLPIRSHVTGYELYDYKMDMSGGCCYTCMKRTKAMQEL